MYRNAINIQASDSRVFYSKWGSSMNKYTIGIFNRCGYMGAHSLGDIEYKLGVL